MSAEDPLMTVSDDLDVLPATEVAPGIVRRELPATEFARAWVIDFAPGTEWPEVDVHHGEERYFVVRGEILEGDRALKQGAYVVFAPGSRHRPRSERGCRILGINAAE